MVSVHLYYGLIHNNHALCGQYFNNHHQAHLLNVQQYVFLHTPK